MGNKLEVIRRMREGPGFRRALTMCCILLLAGCSVSLFVASTLLGGAWAEAGLTEHKKVVKELDESVALCAELSEQMLPYDVVFRRDPMQPLVDSKGRLVSPVGLHGGISVQGIIWSEERPLAVLDDELIAKGDVIGPYSILEIRTDGLIAQREGNTEILWVPLDRGVDTPSGLPPDLNP